MFPTASATGSRPPEAAKSPSTSTTAAGNLLAEANAANTITRYYIYGKGLTALADAATGQRDKVDIGCQLAKPYCTVGKSRKNYDLIKEHREYIASII